ncbi:MAG: nodulation protein NfeD [Thermoprotei archaeon]|nr:MAG: nodulation protein NfeD [Thermoprotei archaeon]
MMDKKCSSFLLLIVLIFHALTLAAATKVVIVEVSRDIDAGALGIIRKGLEKGEEVKAELVILKLNTFGGYLSSMDEIIDLITNSGIKVVVWIPPGGKAVSAGAFIALACDRLYMGNGSVIGSSEPRPPDPKVVNFSAAWIRSLAGSRWGLNDSRVRIVEEFVLKNRALSSLEALSLGIADGLANSLSDVLALEGVVDSELILVKESIIDELLSLISNPFVVSLLILIGIITLLAELTAAGFQGLGILGGLLLVAGLYGAGLVGLDLVALALIVAGGVLLAVEMVKTGLQGFGFIGGALVIIALIMYFKSQPYIELTLSMVYLIPPLVAFLALALYIAYQVARVTEIRVKKVEEELIGRIGVAKTKIEEKDKGVVYIMGEDWSALSLKGSIEPGTKVKVVSVEGLTLIVEPV